MKYRCFAALALAMLLSGCAAAPDLTPVWQRDLPASGVHIELACRHTEYINSLISVTYRQDSIRIERSIFVEEEQVTSHQ